MYISDCRYRTDKEKFQIQNFWPLIFPLFSLIEKNCTAIYEELIRYQERLLFDANVFQKFD